MFLFVLFVLGTFIGSFLNVCIWRLPRGESVAQPPSHCPHCNTRLHILDLVPLLSQVLLRARCRYCGAKISWRYFGIELLTGCLFVLVGNQPGNLNGDWLTGAWVGDPMRLLQGLIFVSTLVVIFWIDYKTHLIQLEAVFILGLAGLGMDVWQVTKEGRRLTDGALFVGAPLLPAPLPQSLLAMVITATGLWILREAFSWYYGKEALGFGDVILVAAIAANLGWNATILTFFFLSVVVGATIGVGLKIPHAIRSYTWARARARRESKRSLAWPLARHAFRKTIPFGPMLAAGAIVALLYGERINEAYLNRVNPAFISQTSSNPTLNRPPDPLTDGIPPAPP